MKKIILNVLIIATSLLSLTTNADQIISLTKTEVRALNAALSEPITVQALFKCKENVIELLNAGAKLKRGNYTGSMYGTQYQFEFANAGRAEILVVRETYRDGNGTLLNPSVVECSKIK